MTAAVDPLVASWEARPADPNGCVARVAAVLASHTVLFAGNGWKTICSCGWEGHADFHEHVAVAALGEVKAPADDPHTTVQRDDHMAAERGLIAVRQMAFDWYCPNDPRRPRVTCRECVAEVALAAALSGGAR